MHIPQPCARRPHRHPLIHIYPPNCWQNISNTGKIFQGTISRQTNSEAQFAQNPVHLQHNEWRNLTSHQIFTDKHQNKSISLFPISYDHFHHDDQSSLQPVAFQGPPGISKVHLGKPSYTKTGVFFTPAPILAEKFDTKKA